MKEYARKNGSFSFRQLLMESASKMQVIVTFLAILENFQDLLKQAPKDRVLSAAERNLITATLLNIFKPIDEFIVNEQTRREGLMHVYFLNAALRSIPIRYNGCKNDWDKEDELLKEAYLDILMNVPAGLKLTARISTNYRQLKTIYYQRKNHRLPEWRKFCNWMETELPHFKELCLNA